jgi:hypothetical protein
MKEFKSNDKMQCFKEGGQVAYKSRKAGKADMSSDIAQDKKIVKKAFKMHDSQEHEGEHTDLSKLKKGGRAKKDCGTVSRYCGGGMAKYKDGGSVGIYGAKKKSGDLDSIKKAKDIKPKKLAEGGMLKDTDAEENPGLAKLPTDVRNKMGYKKAGGCVAKK